MFLTDQSIKIFSDVRVNYFFGFANKEHTKKYYDFFSDLNFYKISVHFSGNVINLLSICYSHIKYVSQSVISCKKLNYLKPPTY